MESTPVLDKGHIILRRVDGSDLDVVNAARVSYAKRSTDFSVRDANLIRYLAEHKHTSPFRHCSMQFEVKAPLMVAREWWKHVVGSDHVMDAWNEVSRRYVDDEPEFYEPAVWRARAEHNKQGSSGEVFAGIRFTHGLRALITASVSHYRQALAEGVAPEQARLFLPAYAMYTSWIWTASLQAVCHFINLRHAPDAMWEIQQYAQVVEELAEKNFPISVGALCHVET